MNSIGKDFATIRNHQGLSLEEMHRKTRIPLEILQRIENDDLLEEDGSNRIYARGFIRTYAKTLKVDDESILHSLDQYEIGNYNGLLLESFPELKALQKSKDKTDKSDQEKSGSANRSEGNSVSGKSTKKGDTKRAGSNESDKHKSLKSSKKPAGKSTVSSIPVSSGTAMNDPAIENYNWAQVGGRVKSSNRKASPWVIGILIIILILAGAIYLIYDSESMDLSANVPDTGEMTSPTSDEMDEGGFRLDLDVDDGNEPEEEPVPAAAELDEVLYLTLYAAYERLDPVRVYSDMKPRFDPYWMEQGTAFNFEFQDTIRVTGQYQNMLLFLNGHRIENFRQNFYKPEAEAVELTRDLFTDESQWATQIPLDVPEGVDEPDSISIRPIF